MFELPFGQDCRSFEMLIKNPLQNLYKTIYRLSTVTETVSEQNDIEFPLFDTRIDCLIIGLPHTPHIIKFVQFSHLNFSHSISIFSKVFSIAIDDDEMLNVKMPFGHLLGKYNFNISKMNRKQMLNRFIWIFLSILYIYERIDDSLDIH